MFLDEFLIKVCIFISDSVCNLVFKEMKLVLSLLLDKLRRMLFIKEICLFFNEVMIY